MNQNFKVPVDNTNIVFFNILIVIKQHNLKRPDLQTNKN